MDIDITRLFQADTWAFSGSIATHGANAGPATWQAACVEGAASPLLTTEAELDALRDHMRGFGAWEDEEIDAWTADECNAMLIQMVAGDKREGGLDDVAIDDDAAWVEYEVGTEAGRYSGNIYRSGERVFYMLSD